MEMTVPKNIGHQCMFNQALRLWLTISQKEYEHGLMSDVYSVVSL
jgi:hypothetical protein